MTHPFRAPRHVLIVEDDSLTALVLSEYLRAYGYTTTVARTGPDGIDSALAEQPDLALVDILLPRKDGFEVCRAIKAQATTPVVLMSAIYKTEEEAELPRRGLVADGFLRKPFDLDVLVARVQELVGGP